MLTVVRAEEPEILYEPELLLADEAQPLFDRLVRELSWDTRMHARKTASFGEPYNYGQMTYPFAPMHALLVAVHGAVEARLERRYNNCLVNLYESGSHTMGFHRDDLTGCDRHSGVAIVSLGDPRSLTFQRSGAKSQQWSIALAAGSLLWMSGDVQSRWKHAVLAEPERGARVSLTFRWIEPAAHRTASG